MQMLFHNFLFKFDIFHIGFWDLDFANELCIHLLKVSLLYCAASLYIIQKSSFMLLHENMTLQSLKKAKGSNGCEHS